MNSTKLIDGFVEDLEHLKPLPDITPIQKIINKLYMRLRLLGIPLEDVENVIGGLLYKNGLSYGDLKQIN